MDDPSYPAPPMSDPRRDGSRLRGKTLILAALVLLMVATIAGTSYLVLLQLHAPDTGKTASARPVVTATAVATTEPTPPTADLAIPANNGWTAISGAAFGDVRFAASEPRKGYLCGTKALDHQHVFGVTTDGGKTWTFSPSPASYTSCYLQVSASNPLELTLTSVNAPGDGASAFVEAHYSTNGGQSWTAAPIPQNTTGVAQLLWSGQYLYLLLWNSLQVSVNGGAFSSVPMSRIAPGAQQTTLTSAVATANRLYLNVQTNACQSPCNILRASADGGASWATIPDNGKVLLEYVQGNMWYGAVMDGQPTLTTVMRSANGGASWETLTLPPLPDGQEMNSYLVAPDQTLFVSSRSDIAALRQGQWTVYPFSLSETDTVADSLELTAISLDQDGRPLKLWGHDEGAHPGTYWHSV